MRRFLPALVFLALVLVFLWRSTFAGQVLLPGDYMARMYPWSVEKTDSGVRQWDPIQWDAAAQFYPWRTFYARSVREGSLPLWNPHQFCGTPFAANAQSAVFYPPNLLFVLIPPELALGWSAALHLFLAGLFTFLLIRGLGVGKFGACLGGISYAFGAFLITWLELPTLVASATWLPLALLLIHNAARSGRTAPAAGAGIALALSILAGHLQIALYVLLMAGAWWLWLILSREAGLPRRSIRLIVLAALTFVIAFLLAAPQTLPTLELSHLSHRVREVTAEGFSRYQDNAVPARNLITALVPDFYGNPSRGDYWGGAPYAEYALYIGVLPLFMVVLGGMSGIRRGRHLGFFLAVAVISLLSAFGAAINALTYYAIPGFSALGGPNRIIVLYTLSAAVLAGVGADWFVRVCTKTEDPACGCYVSSAFRPALIAISTVAVFYAVAFAIAVGAFQRLSADATIDLLSHIRPQLAIFGVLFLGGAALLLLRGAARISTRTFAGLAIVLLVADLFAFGIAYNPTCSRDLVLSDTTTVQRLQSLVGDERIMPLNTEWSLYITPQAVLPPNSAMLFGLYDVQGYDSLFTRTYKDFTNKLQGEDSSPIENGNIIFFKSYSPEAARIARFILSPAPIDDQGLRLLSSDLVFLYENAEALPFAAIADGEVRVKRRGPNEVVLDVSATRSGRLNIAQVYYPGWKAFINGKTARVKHGEEVFQAVDVPAGRHEVRLSFEPGSVRAGYWLAVAGLLLCAVLVWLSVREGRRKSQ